MNFGGIRNRTGTHPLLRFPNSPIYPLFAGIARPVRYDVRKRYFLLSSYLSTIYGVQGRTDFECPHSVGFLRCSLPCTITQGAPCPGFGYRIRQAVCKLSVCRLCTGAFSRHLSRAVAPRWAKIGNTCVSFHAVSIHTEGSAPRVIAPPSSCGHWDIYGRLHPLRPLPCIAPTSRPTFTTMRCTPYRLSAPQACPAQSHIIRIC